MTPATPADREAVLARCPDGCFRPKARNADDCAAGCCAKWYAVRDPEAAAECAKLAAFWSQPAASGVVTEADGLFALADRWDAKAAEDIGCRDNLDRALQTAVDATLRNCAKDLRALATQPPALAQTQTVCWRCDGSGVMASDNHDEAPCVHCRPDATPPDSSEQAMGEARWALALKVREALDKVSCPPLFMEVAVETIAAATPPADAVRYRELGSKDTLLADDEFLDDDCITWLRAGDRAKLFVGQPYVAGVMKAARRALESLNPTSGGGNGR